MRACDAVVAAVAPMAAAMELPAISGTQTAASMKSADVVPLLECVIAGIRCSGHPCYVPARYCVVAIRGIWLAGPANRSAGWCLGMLPVQ